MVTTTRGQPPPQLLAHCPAGGIIPISGTPKVEGPCCSFCSPFGSMMAFESPVGKTVEGNVEGNMAGAPASEQMGWP